MTISIPAVHNEIVVRTRKLLGIFSSTSTPGQKEIVLSALTYFFDIEDYIRDDIDFTRVIDATYVYKIDSAKLAYNKYYLM